MRRDLLRYGPQFPDSYDPSNFSIKALVNTNWPMVVEYELEQGSTAVITIQVMEADPFTQTLVGEGMGKPRTARFTLPVYKGRGPHPALISFKARRDGAGRKERAAFHLSGVGAGKSAVASLPKGANGLEVASIGHLPLGGVRAVAFCPHGAVNVYCVTFNATSSGYEYNFYVGNKFDVWGADIVTVEQVGKTDKDQGFQVAFKPEPIGPDLNPLSDVWNGLGKDGRKARRGKYRVRVKAWLSAENTADWAAKHSESDPIEIN